MSLWATRSKIAGSLLLDVDPVLALAGSAGRRGLLGAMKVEGGTVHAVTQSAGLRTVVEDVAEMAAASAAVHFGAAHEETSVGLSLDRTVDRRREAGPTGSAVELGGRGEQRLAAAGTVIDTLAVFLVERA